VDERGRADAAPGIIDTRADPAVRPVDSDGAPFTALAKRKGVSSSDFTRLVRLTYLAPDITQAILDGRQPRDLTAEKLLAHSRLPLAWDEQRKVLGFA
jgi:site-specific DNA recombinase